MKRLWRVATSNALLFVSACSGLHAQASAPAVIVNSNAASRAELLLAIADAVHGEHIAIADDALTYDSVLWIQRAQRHSTAGVKLNGRDLEEPDKFLLVKQGTRCVLIHERSGQRRTLKSAQCRTL